jgi:hypothetical protein
MLQHIFRLFRGVLRVERHEYGADLRDSKNRQQKLGAIWHHESDTIASFDADSDETIGNSIDFPLESGIAPLIVFEDQRQFLGMLFDSVLKHLVQCCGRCMFHVGKSLLARSKTLSMILSVSPR